MGIDGNGLIIQRDGFVRLFLRILQYSLLNQRSRMFRVDFQRLVEVGHGLRGVAFNRVQLRPAAESVREIGLELQRFFDVGIGFNILFLLDLAAGQSFQSHRRIGIKLQGFLFIGNQLVDVLFQAVGYTPIAVGFGILVVELDCPVERVDGFIELAAADIAFAAIIPGNRMVPFFQNREIGTVNRLEILPFLEQRQRTFGIGIGPVTDAAGVAAVLAGHLFELGDGGIVFALPIQDHALHHQRLVGVRFNFDGFVHQFQRGVPFPLGQMLFGRFEYFLDLLLLGRLFRLFRFILGSGHRRSEGNCYRGQQDGADSPADGKSDHRATFLELRGRDVERSLPYPIYRTSTERA